MGDGVERGRRLWYNAGQSPVQWEERFLETIDLARQIADLASDRKAREVTLLDIRPCTLLADYFVICSGDSERQIRAITEDVREALARQGVRPLQIEGAADSGWVLMDYGAVIFHIFAPAERDYYRLERLWSAAVTVLRMQ